MTSPDNSWRSSLLSYLTSEGSPGRESILLLLSSPGHPQDHAALLLDACQPWSRGGAGHFTGFLEILFLAPERILREADEVAAEACGKVHREVRGDPRYSPKEWVHVRISLLPNVPIFRRPTLPRSEDVGLLVEIRGTVVKTALPRTLEKAKTMRCSRCGTEFLASADYAQFYRLSRPSSCPGSSGCPGTYFSVVSRAGEKNNLELCADFQEIKVQEQTEHLAMGAIPRSIWVTLEDDLVDSCKPGDDVVVNGIVKTRWHPLGKSTDGRTDIELVVRANYVHVSNAQKSKKILTDERVKEFEDFWKKHRYRPLAGRNEILASFCPQVYGLYAIKLALAIVLCGGVERVDGGATKVRGESHMLLVGDPGTGKSQLVRYASRLSPRSVLTTGVGSTRAGLTVSAVKDGGAWHLEAGALVLADGGVCCVDEFSTIAEADRTCIHEAMEQQSISVAKAGLVCKLHTRCSVLAATNPKGSYDLTQPLTVNTGIASPLLSRFDLVLVLLDSRNEEWDRLVSSYVLQGKDPTKEDQATQSSSTLWSLDKLRAYFAYSKRFQPELSPDASTVLSQYYQCQRRSDYPNMARTTVRLLQSTIRLAQGHARLMCRDTVTIEDAVWAVLLLETSAESASSASLAGGGGGGVNPLHTTFPSDASEEYRARAEEVLVSVLQREDLWRKEKTRLGELEVNLIGQDAHEMEDWAAEGDNVDRDMEQSQRIRMTQMVTKLRTNQISYGTECALAAREKEKRKKKGQSKGLEKFVKSKKHASKASKKEKKEEVEEEPDSPDIEKSSVVTSTQIDGPANKRKMVVFSDEFESSEEEEGSGRALPLFKSKKRSASVVTSNPSCSRRVGLPEVSIIKDCNRTVGEPVISEASSKETLPLEERKSAGKTPTPPTSKLSSKTVSKLKLFECSDDEKDEEGSVKQDFPGPTISEVSMSKKMGLPAVDLNKTTISSKSSSCHVVTAPRLEVGSKKGVASGRAMFSTSDDEFE